MSKPKNNTGLPQNISISKRELEKYNHVIESLLEKGDVQRVLENPQYNLEEIDAETQEELTTTEYWEVARQALNANITAENQEIRSEGNKPEVTAYMDIAELFSYVKRMYPEHKKKDQEPLHRDITSKELDELPYREKVEDPQEVKWTSTGEESIELTEPEKYAQGHSSFVRLGEATWEEIDLGYEETKFRYVGETPIDETDL